MAEFSVVPIDQNRDQLIVFRLKHRIDIDIDHLDAEIRHARLAAQGFQRSEHVVAQMAVVAAEQPQLRRRPALRRITYRAGP
jgi:hypothetical protein